MALESFGRYVTEI